MNYLYKILCASTVLIALYSFAVEKSNIETTVGKTFVIVLPENPTTGYTWFWQVSDDIQKRPLELVRKEFTAKEPSMIGSGGTVRFTFKAMRLGATPIILTLKRIWDKNSDVDQKRFDVIIHPKKHKKAKK